MTWLARHTDRAAQTVYQYASGQTRPSLAWLVAAARLINPAMLARIGLRDS